MRRERGEFPGAEIELPDSPRLRQRHYREIGSAQMRHRGFRKHCDADTGAHQHTDVFHSPELNAVLNLAAEARGVLSQMNFQCPIRQTDERLFDDVAEIEGLLIVEAMTSARDHHETVLREEPGLQCRQVSNVRNHAEIGASVCKCQRDLRARSLSNIDRKIRVIGEKIAELARKNIRQGRCVRPQANASLEADGILA